jgi:hypothetical protein
MITPTFISGDEPRRWANSGWGPPARKRSERIRSTLLDRDDGEIRCPLIIRLGFSLLPGENPLEYLSALLAEQGVGSPEDLRHELEVPDMPHICRPNPNKAPSNLTAPTTEVLWHALMLGLCTAQVYDPRRPVIWTRGSLTRVIDLFDPEGFYA